MDRLQVHLVKCRKNHPGYETLKLFSNYVYRLQFYYWLQRFLKNRNRLPRSDLAICPFNRTHHVSHAEFQLHKMVCQDRRVVEQDM